MASPLSFNIDPGTSAEDLAARRQLAYSLMQQGGSGDPIRSPWQGVNRIAQALVGGYDAYRIDRDQKDEKRQANALLGEALGTSATPAATTPAPGALPPPGAPPAAPMPSTPAQGAFAAAGRDYVPPVSAVPSGALDLIKREEGFVPNAAWDKRQFSNGYGTKATAEGEQIDEAEANRRLLAETAPLNAWISRNVKAPLTDDQRNSLMSFGHNLGAGALQKLLPDLNAGNFAAVAQRMPSFNQALNEKTGQLEPMDALTQRRMREAAPFAAGPAATPGATPAAAARGPLGIEPQMASLIQRLSANKYTEGMANKLFEMATKKPDLQVVAPGASVIDPRNPTKPLFTAAKEETRSDLEKRADAAGLVEGTPEYRKFMLEGPEKQARQGNPITNAAEIRKEFDNHSKNFEVQLAGADRVNVGAHSDSPQGDIALVYGFMKMLDPSSVVREGEFATAEQTGGVPERVRIMYNKAVNGERLTPEMRDSFVSQADQQMRAARLRQDALTQRYSGIATRAGMDPRDIITTYAASPGGEATGPSAPPAAQRQLAPAGPPLASRLPPNMAQPQQQPRAPGAPAPGASAPGRGAIGALMASPTPSVIAQFNAKYNGGKPGMAEAILQQHATTRDPYTGANPGGGEVFQ